MVRRLWQPVFLKQFKQNSTKHFSVKQKNKIEYKYIRNIYIKREKETTHVKIGKRTVITTSNVYISTSTRFAITTWSKDLRYMNDVSKIKRKEKDT